MSSLKRLQNFSIENAATIRIGLAALFLGVIFFLGSVGYHLIEGLSFFDGFYRTFITISTIGFREVSNLSVEGRILTVAVFVLGIGVIPYIAIISGNRSIDFNPGGDTILKEGDSLIVLGDQDKIDVFRTTVCQDERPRQNGPKKFKIN
ncbi:MAG: ion channel [Gracilimonas sp.]|nr:ion channel [Gracilimonas sp.]